MSAIPTFADSTRTSPEVREAPQTDTSGLGNRVNVHSGEGAVMAATRKLAAILVSDVVGYSRLAGSDEDRILARLRALRSDLIDPIIAVHGGRVVKRTGDGAIVEFRSVVDAVRCAIEVQDGMLERNAGVSPERRIEFRIGIHLGDVVEESDGDLMGDGVNIAARIEGLAKPGAICLSEDAYRQIKSRLDLAVNDLGERQLKNIAEPIRLYSLEVGKPAPVKPSEPGRPSTSPGALRLSVVVLPFANLGGDPQQEHFVDGVTESLTTGLSRLSGATVIARNTAFTYRGKHVDVKQIGRDLNIRYVLEGSVQRGGDRLRINVQLIDVETGAHLWAERFDKPVTDLFDMQDEIVARLANALNAELTALEARRAEQSPHPDSMDHYFQGMAWANKGVNPHNFTKARACFESALALDPDNVDALVGVGMVDSKMVGAGLADDRVARLASAEAALNKALSLAPNHPWEHT
jgi:TolB-like protein/class 3 adenylate cyclase